MNVAAWVEQSARLVRLVVLTALLATLPALVALRAFDQGHTRTYDAVVDRSCVGSCRVESPQVAVLARRLEAQGLRCSKDPVLTDHVVAETVDGVVSELRFDEALRRSAAGEVWVRRYCA